MLRTIITIEEELCNGCGLCIPNCPEGALQIIDNKARLVSDLFCDGLGACVGFCPEGAMRIVEREAEPYDERKVMANIVRQGENTIAAHLLHLKDHGEMNLYREAVQYLHEQGLEVPEHKPEAVEPLPCACPGSVVAEFNQDEELQLQPEPGKRPKSRLTHWPVQIKLLPLNAPYFQGADLLLAADCAPFAFAAFHEEFLTDKVLLVGCPKLDDPDFYREKITAILESNEIRSLTCVHMEVPCCFGLPTLARDSIAASGKEIPFHDVTVTIDGRIHEAIPV